MFFFALILVKVQQILTCLTVILFYPITILDCLTLFDSKRPNCIQFGLSECKRVNVGP